MCALGVAIGAVITHEIITRWRYDQSLRILNEGGTVIKGHLINEPRTARYHRPGCPRGSQTTGDKYGK
jgi:hypothetical protein